MIKLSEESKSNETMTIQEMKDILIQLGYLIHFNEIDESTSDSIWALLGGKAKNYITLNNFRIFLLAV